MPEGFSDEAPAKLNPYLRVVRRRDDGYHDVETIVLPLDLADRVSLTPRETPGFALRVTGPRAAGVPTGDDNLALRAAFAFAEATGVIAGAAIEIEKHVPVAAGLGGGSADAAAVLRLLDRAWATGLGEEGLCRIAAGVGSDVPALVLGRPAMATGRGERVHAIDVAPTWWVLATFDAGVLAEDAYRWWDLSLRRRLDRPRPVSEALRALNIGDPGEIAATLHNSLEPEVVRRHPSVAAARDALVAAGAAGVLVSGSGPTVAGLVASPADARIAADSVGGVAVAGVGTA